MKPWDFMYKLHENEQWWGNSTSVFENINLQTETACFPESVVLEALILFIGE